MREIKPSLVMALAILAAATFGRTLSSDPEWRSLSAKGADVALEELTLSVELRDQTAEGAALAGAVDVTFKSDYFSLN
jgi:hypothetical protein